MSTATAETTTVANDDTKHPRPRPVLVLDHFQETIAQERWEKALTLHRDAILSVSAYARGEVQNPKVVGNGGITVSIELDGQTVAADLSFADQSKTIEFHASASHSTFLKAGKHNLTISRKDTRLTKPGEMVICYHLTAAGSRQPH